MISIIPKLYTIKSKNKIRYLVENEPGLNCNKCEENIEEYQIVYIIEKYFRKQPAQIEVVCLNCLEKIYFNSEVESRKCAIVVNKIPKKAIYYIYTTPILATSQLYDTFGAVTQMKGRPRDSAPIIKDKTVHAGRESWQGSQIGDNSKIKDQIDYSQMNKKQIKQNIKRRLIE